MGPITLVDKSAIQALHFAEVLYLDRYYSLVISPILLRELLSTLAKEPHPKKDWEKTLSILAAKVDTFNSFIPPHAAVMARGNLLGVDIPMTGQVPLAHGKTVRARNGTYGVILDEQPEAAVLRDWKNGIFSETQKKDALLVRRADHAIDLSNIQKEIESQLKHYPDFAQLSDLVRWLDETYFPQVSQEFHIRGAASSILERADIEKVVQQWKAKGSPLFSEFSPYAFYVYRCNTVYLLGIGKHLIPTSKSANTHLDMQYIYYLPFCMAFTSSDNFLLDFAKFFIRQNQSIIPGNDLKRDLKGINDFLQNLSDEERASISTEFGSYPPDAAAPLTSSIWMRHMAPRPQMKDAVPKWSKEQNRSIAQEITRFIEDSIDVETNETNSSKAKTRWLDVSVLDRGLQFVNEALKIVGADSIQDWDEIRKTFNHELVRKIYDVHADIWRPDDDHLMLSEGLRNESRSRFLYLGDIEPEDILANIWRWSLHFDQILIPDPFQSPWARKEDFNPIANPTLFESDTLKLVYLLVALYPLIAAKKVAFIQDPSDFNPEMKKTFVDVAKRNELDKDLMKAAARDGERLHPQHVKAQLRIYARLPEPQRSRAIRNLFSTEIECHLRHLALLRQSDPLCIDRECDLKGGELIIARSGASFETSVILSALYDATPISSLETRNFQYHNAAHKPSDVSSKIFAQFLKTPGFNYIDPFFSSFMAERDALKEFRDLLALILGGNEITEEKTMEILAIVRDDCSILCEIYGKSTGRDASELLTTSPLTILNNQNGFTTDGVLTLANNWYPDINLAYPKYFVGLPQ